MTQKAWPVSDVSDGGWQPQPVYRQINEETPDDATFVSSASDPQGDTFEVKLKPLAYPAEGLEAPEGLETLTVRLRRVDTGAGSSSSSGATTNGSTTITLLQGDRVVASQVVEPTSSFADYALILTNAQIALITDYSDLRVRVTAGPVIVSCCPGELLPATLVAHFVDSGGCACLDGLVLPLLWNATLSRWETITTACEQHFQMQLFCNGVGCNEFSLSGACSTGLFDASSPTSCVCSPFQIVFSGILMTGSGCCAGGQFQVTILTS